YACVFLNGVYHGDTLKRLAEIHLNSVVNDLCCSKYILCHMAVQVLCQIHHTVIIGVCLIELHQSKLRIMAGVQTLIPEYSSDLINTFHSADDQTFQIKLQRNTKLEVLVQCVEMCLKRSCCCSACVCHKHWSLNFQESLRIQVFPDTAQNFGTFDKCIFYLAVHDQIHISLSVSCICICQAVEFLRKHLQTL